MPQDPQRACVVRQSALTAVEFYAWLTPGHIALCDRVPGVLSIAPRKVSAFFVKNLMRVYETHATPQCVAARVPLCAALFGAAT